MICCRAIYRKEDAGRENCICRDFGLILVSQPALPIFFFPRRDHEITHRPVYCILGLRPWIHHLRLPERAETTRKPG